LLNKPYKKGINVKLKSTIKLRKELHKHPELSNFETDTALRIKSFFSMLNPDNVIENIGGTGIAFEFFGSQYNQLSTNKVNNDRDHSTLLLRCELDALPIQETNKFEYRSVYKKVSHKCGHDGHMAILCEVGKYLSQNRPINGRVILLFQPAEEIGSGAFDVINDPLFINIKPDYSFALHNLPGKKLGEVYVKPGLFNFASTGVIIQLEGVESHAAYPENGINPTNAMCEIVQKLNDLPSTINQSEDTTNLSITIISVQMGEGNFGTSPGSATIMATFRSNCNKLMGDLINKAEQIIKQVSNREKLEYSLSLDDVFSTCINSSVGYNKVIKACDMANVNCVTIDQPYRWSEDFGVLLESTTEGAMFTIGAGENSPQLHNSDYDFPDELIPIASSVFIELIRDINQFK
jgi:amidohydrolase